MELVDGASLRIGYLTHEPLPSSETSTEQLVWTVSMVAREGIDIDLVLPGPAEVPPSTEQYRHSIRTFYGSVDELLPERVRLTPVWRAPFASGDFRRAIHDVAAPFVARRRKFDVGYTRDLYALSLMLTLGIPTFFETYRTDINTLRRFGLFRRFVYPNPRLLGVVAHSQLCRDLFEREGVGANRLLVAYNGYSPRVMEPVRSKEEARAALALDSAAPVVAYTGHVNANKGVDILVSLAARLPEVSFVVVGAVEGSPGEREMLRLMAEANVPNLQLRPRVPPTEISNYLYAADCLIIPPTAKPLERFHRTVLPMKTYLYLAAGRAIVAPDLPDLREVLVDGRNAVLVAPDDIDACASRISSLLSDREERERLGSQAMIDASLYTWRARGNAIADFIRERAAAAAE